METQDSISIEEEGVGSPEDESAVIILQQQQGEGWAEVGPMEAVSGGRKKGQSKPRETSLTAQCLICTGPAAAHQHYGAVCCYSCRAFFRRGITRSYVCVRGDDMCQVNSITRTNCKRCRYARCLAVGMQSELVDATLKRKMEEKRRQELVEIQQEMGIQVQQSRPPQQQHTIRNGVQQLLQAQQVLAAVQGIQYPHSEVDPIAATEVGERPDENLIYQALEGKKKVLLELRHNSPASPAAPPSRPPVVIQQQYVQQVQQIQQQEQSYHEEAPQLHLEEPRGHAPLRQQTYYIFHPLTQTFEPITIAEFEENDVIEEVVVAEDYSVGKQEEIVEQGEMMEQEEQMIAVTNEHDYVEVPPEGGLAQVAKRPRYMEEPLEEVEMKPVVSPIVQVTGPTAGVKQEFGNFGGQVSVIRRLLPAVQAAPAVVTATLGQARRSTDLSKVIQETIGDVKETAGEVEKEEQEVEKEEEQEEPKEEVEEEQVDIEKLVDFCFEEELQKPPENEKQEPHVEKLEGAQRKRIEVEKREEAQKLHVETPKMVHEPLVEKLAEALKPQAEKLEGALNPLVEVQKLHVEKPKEAQKPHLEKLEEVHKMHVETLEVAQKPRVEKLEEVIELQVELEETQQVEKKEKPIAVLKKVKDEDMASSSRRPQVIQKNRKFSGRERQKDGSPLPLKKRRKMCHYPIAMAINRQQVPIVSFTIEEEFRLHDLKARYDHVNTLVMKAIFALTPDIMDNMMASFISSFRNKVRIKENEKDLERLNNASRELYAIKAKDIFDEFKVLKKGGAYKVLNSNWPAVMVLQGVGDFIKAKKGLKYQCQNTTGMSKEIYVEMIQRYPEFEELVEEADQKQEQGVGFDDYEIFQSPWAQTMDDEVFYEKTFTDLMEVLGEDDMLYIVYSTLLMATQPPGVNKPNKPLQGIQGDLAQLLYRYLASKLGLKRASEVAYTLTGFINKLHRCGDIFLNRRIKLLTEEEEASVESLIS